MGCLSRARGGAGSLPPRSSVVDNGRRMETELSAAKHALLEQMLRNEAPKRRPSVPAQPSAEASDTRTPVVALQPSGRQRPFFYLHVHWQGGAFYCFNIARALGSDQPFYVFDPYRYDDLPTPPTIETMAADYLAAIRRIQPKGPYLLGAFCGAAPLGYEMAQQLRREGESADLLAFIDPMARSLEFTRLTRRLLRWAGLTPARQLDWFLRLRYLTRVAKGTHDEYTEFADRLIREWNEQHPRRFRVLPDSGALRRDWLGSFIWALAGYYPQPYPGKVTYLYASENPDSRKLWWGTVRKSGPGADVRLLPGNHVTCRTTHLDHLTEQLRSCLTAAQTPPADGPPSSLAS